MKFRRLLVAALLAIAPVQAELPMAARQAVVDYLDRAVAEQLAPGGSLLVLDGDEPVIDHAFGLADRETGRRWTTREPVRIASLSKSLVATVILRLAVRGVVDLDTPIDAYLPLFAGVKLADGTPAARAPTLREILGHRGGLPSDEESGRPWQKAEYRARPLGDVIAEFVAAGLRAQPDERYAYSGFGSSVAAYLAEQLTGQSFEALLQQELCRPLGLRHTTYFPDAETAARIPKMYRRTADGWERRQTRPLPIEGNYFSHAGEIITTADDLATFLKMIRDGGVHAGRTYLPPEQVAHWLTLPAPPRTRYALGLSLGREAVDGGPEWLGHTGSSGTMFWWDRTNGQIGVLLTQTADPADAELLPPPEFIWLVRYRVDGAFNQANRDGRLRVGIYRGPGSSSATVSNLQAVLHDPAALVLETLTVDRIRDGHLTSFDVAIFPGGSGSAQSSGLGDAGREAVRQYVAAGGGYLGICAGAYLACDGFSWGLKILDAKTASNYWRRGVGEVKIELTDAGRRFFGVAQAQHAIHYANGPILVANGNAELDDFEPLAYFRTELAENDTPIGLMVGTPAMVRGSYGRGRVLAFSPHAESTDGLRHWIRAAVEHAAGRR